MTIKSKFNKKITALVLAFTLSMGFGTVVYASTFGNLKNGASNEEVLQVKYNGAAWNYSNSGYDWASFKYTRNGKTLLVKFAYSGKVTGSVWDDLVHWGKKYTTYFTWNRG